MGRLVSIVGNDRQIMRIYKKAMVGGVGSSRKWLLNILFHTNIPYFAPPPPPDDTLIGIYTYVHNHYDYLAVAILVMETASYRAGTKLECS